MRPRVAVAPEDSELVNDAVQRGGGDVVGLDEQPDALVWLAPDDVAGLERAVRTARSVRWVQLPFAGVKEYVHVLEPSRTWTCAKGVYAEPTAEHALALGLAGLRQLPARARARS